VWIAVCVIDEVVLCEMREAGRKASVATLFDALVQADLYHDRSHVVTQVEAAGSRDRRNTNRYVGRTEQHQYLALPRCAIAFALITARRDV
jgi:hypothetical protein